MFDIDENKFDRTELRTMIELNGGTMDEDGNITVSAELFEKMIRTTIRRTMLVLMGGMTKQ